MASSSQTAQGHWVPAHLLLVIPAKAGTQWPQFPKQLKGTGFLLFFCSSSLRRQGPSGLSFPNSSRALDSCSSFARHPCEGRDPAASVSQTAQGHWIPALLLLVIPAKAGTQWPQFPKQLKGTGFLLISCSSSLRRQGPSGLSFPNSSRALDSCSSFARHPCEGRDPVASVSRRAQGHWVPAFAGMTTWVSRFRRVFWSRSQASQWTCPARGPRKILDKPSEPDQQHQRDTECQHGGGDDQPPHFAGRAGCLFR